MVCLPQALEQKLSEAVGEAKAFAAQQQADADRTKRSYSQVLPPLQRSLMALAL